MLYVYISSSVHGMCFVAPSLIGVVTVVTLPRKAQLRTIHSCHPPSLVRTVHGCRPPFLPTVVRGCFPRYPPEDVSFPLTLEGRT